LVSGALASEHPKRKREQRQLRVGNRKAAIHNTVCRVGVSVLAAAWAGMPLLCGLSRRDLIGNLSLCKMRDRAIVAQSTR